jgi:hypothetical protein
MARLHSSELAKRHLGGGSGGAVAVDRRSDELAVAGDGELARGRTGSKAEREALFFFFTL